MTIWNGTGSDMVWGLEVFVELCESPGPETKGESGGGDFSRALEVS